MSSRTVAYWVTTGLFSAGIAFSGFATATHQPGMVAAYQHLGYPLYFMTILGVAKLLGAATLLAPGLPRLKEWAYAGFAINLGSAFLSHLAMGDAANQAVMPLVFLAMALASWALRPASRTLAPVLGATSEPSLGAPAHAAA
ncbi:MAG: DoxX family protein [Polyangiales bacterium]